MVNLVQFDIIKLPRHYTRVVAMATLFFYV
ncbi:hypothetical protein BE20_0022 [Staphylococcus phage vB_SepS_BE20]|nr:hypothetical protein BE20_0022 [Staphylococcus phage vB_SepS_BE20]